MGGPLCYISKFKKITISPCAIFTMSMSILKWSYVACQISEITYVMLFIIFFLVLGSMSHVDFTKWPYRCVKFKGRDPPSLVRCAIVEVPL